MMAIATRGPTTAPAIQAWLELEWVEVTAAEVEDVVEALEEVVDVSEVDEGGEVED